MARRKRLKLSPAMQRLAEELIKKFNIPVERANEPEFYLSDHLTGQPLIRSHKARGKSRS